MFSNKLNYKIINFAALMLLFYMTFSNIGIWLSLVKKIIEVIAPILFSFAFAYSLYPLVLILKNKKLTKLLAVTITIISFTLIFILIINKSLPIIYEQLVLFSKYILTFINQFSNRFNINIGIEKFHLLDYLNTIITQLSNIISKSTITIFNKSVNLFIQLLTGYLFGIYFLWNMDKIRQEVKNISLKISIKLYNYLKIVDIEINNYVKGLILSMIIQLVEYSLLFLLIGHPNWLLLGILAAVSNIIPYFGALVTNILGIIIAFNVSTRVLIGTILVCIICPFIDNYLIMPKIYKKTNDINPFIAIILITISGSIFGLMGIIIILPIYLLLRTTYLYLIDNYKTNLRKIKITHF